jgi:hypothetical protein
MLAKFAEYANVRDKKKEVLAQQDLNKESSLKESSRGMAEMSSLQA